jgi:predicted small lipoprotein YifL
MARHPVLLALAAAILALAACGERQPLALFTPADDSVTGPAIRAENNLPGCQECDPPRLPASETDVAAFLDVRSVAPGDSVHVFGIARDSQLSIRLYRLGWYAGAGGRLVLDAGVARVPVSGPCTAPAPGPVECAWPEVASFRVPPDAFPGVYAVRYQDRGGEGGVIPLVIRNRRPTPILVVLSFNTYQAYNGWGGSSLYDLGPVVQVPRVSFHRPYTDWTLERHFRSTDLPLVRFLERWGYPVSYLSDADFDADSSLGDRSRLVVISGHAEYWTTTMRHHADRLVGGGVGMGFFGGNDVFWRVRTEGRAAGYLGDVVVCYKHQDDPLSMDRSPATGHFRDGWVKEPENALIGVMYDFKTDTRQYAPLAVRDTDWVFFRGTGFEAGSRTPAIGGWEGDRIMDNGHTPRGIRVLFEARFISDDGVADVMQTTFYTAKSGAGVFAAGTVGWNWGLDDLQPRTTDPRLQQFVRNLLDWYLAGAATPAYTGH